VQSPRIDEAGIPGEATVRQRLGRHLDGFVSLSRRDCDGVLLALVRTPAVRDDTVGVIPVLNVAGASTTLPCEYANSLVLAKIRQRRCPVVGPAVEVVDVPLLHVIETEE